MSRNVAICVDGLGDRWLGGVNYYRNLVKVFDRADVDDMTLYVLTDDASFLKDESLTSKVKVIELPFLKRKSPSWVVRKALHVLAGRDVLVLRLLKRLGVGLVAFSYVGGTRSAGIACAPWVPDFQSKRNPQFTTPEIVLAEERRTRRYLRDYRALIVSSESAAKDATHFFGVPRERLRVLRFAPLIDFSGLTDRAARDAALGKYAIERPYFFLPNQYWKHKNHMLVAQALKALRDEGVEPLVISTGNTSDHRNPGYFAEFTAYLERHGLQGSYRILGIVPRKDMMLLLANSIGVVNPSMFEGWSSTVEEAKALGKTLLVSDIPVHLEQVLGYEKAHVFQAADPVGLAALIKSLHTAETGFDRFLCAPDPSRYQTFSERYVKTLRELLATAG